MIKTPTKFIALLSGATFLAALTAQAVETDPVGYVSQAFTSGTHLVSAPLFTSLVASGAAGTVSGADVDIAGLPALTEAHFLLVTSGTAAGQISTILSTSGDTATLESAIVGLATSDTVKVIKHFNLGDLHTASGSTIPDNTTCTVYNSDGTSDSYFAGVNNWYATVGFALSDDVIVFPGEGVVVGFTGPTTLTFTGLVNVDNIIVPITAGAVNIAGSLNPSAPVGAGSIGDALSELPENSTITLYSNDGLLTATGTYFLGAGDWYNTVGFALTDISAAAPGAIVVGPTSTSSAEIPAAYTSAQ